MQRVLQLLSLQLLQEHLDRENTRIHNGNNRRKEFNERIKHGSNDENLAAYLSFAYLVGGGVQAHLVIEQRWDFFSWGSGVLWEQNPELLYELLQGQDNKDHANIKKLMVQRRTAAAMSDYGWWLEFDFDIVSMCVCSTESASIQHQNISLSVPISVWLSHGFSLELYGTWNVYLAP